MAKGPLRTALEGMARETFTPPGTTNYFDDVRARHAEFRSVVQKLIDQNAALVFMNMLGVIAADIMYSLTGSQLFIQSYKAATTNNGVPDVSEYLAKAIAAATDNPNLRELSETYGVIFTEPYMSFFEGYAGKEESDPMEFLRGIHGAARTGSVLAGFLDLAVEAATAGQFHFFSDMNAEMVKSLGLEWVAFHAMQPLMNVAVLPNLNKYYMRKFRPTRFGMSDMRDLYALGKVTKDTLYEEARALGWRDQDIEPWLQLSFRKLSEAEILEAWKTDQITQDQAAVRLRELGFDPSDIPLVFALNPKDDPNAEKETTAATARQAFRDNLIPEAELRTLLAALKYGTREIDLIVQIEKAKGVANVKGLSLGQIKSAWQDNVLTDPEAVHWLQLDNYGPEQIDLILQTWKAESEPKFRKLNASTIEGAYVEGILNRNDTLTRLVGVGFGSGDADLELKLVEARNPEAFGHLPNVKAKKLTPGTLSDLVLLKLMTPAQMSARLQTLGYTVDDANLLSEAARLRALPGPRLLSQAAIEGAYLAGVIKRETAAGQLESVGFSAAQSVELLDTLEKQNPTVFGLPVTQRVRQLSPSALQDLFLADLLTADEYAGRLADLGLPEGDVQLELARAQQLKTPGNRVLSQSAIERAYLAGVYDRQTAFDRLVAQDFSEEDANTILDTIEAQNPAAFTPGLIQSTRQPSITALVAALQNGIIDEATYFARAQEIGYAVQDAQMYLSLATLQVRKSTRSLSPSELLQAYKAGLLTRGQTLDRLMTNGYSNEDATLLLRIAKDFIQGTDAWDQLLAGSISAMDAVAALVGSKYSDQDIIDAFAQLPAVTLTAMGIDLQILKDTLSAIPGGQ